MKKEMKIKKDNLIISLLILLSEYSIFWFTILFGFTSLNISINEAFKRMYSLRIFIPEVLDIIEPPTIVRNKKNSEKLLDELLVTIPEVLILLNILINISMKLEFSIIKNNIVAEKKIENIIKKSSE